ncbi:MAG TPA: DUF4349 domain-containing protein [Leptolyngbyaceae cyanobacterium M65_K2018_010]|nr:DUF4349 domain-containing protein [Leptolyngbyaceae cyanobacterium M65_K2018_010]
MKLTLDASRRGVNLALGLTMAIGMALVTSCAHWPPLGQESTAGVGLEPAPPAPGEQSRQGSGVAAEGAAPAGLDPVATDLGQPTPQWVKQASLVLLLADVEAALESVQQIVQAAGGDLINLQDDRSSTGLAHQITLTLRVPEAQLTSVLAAIRPLGTVQRQSLTVEEVSTQLVDLEARVKNLRQSEQALLNIMERSGEIAQVLEVARELSTVRDSIERLAAQQQNLQRQVAYSQIDLTLQSPVADLPPLRPMDEILGHTWQVATRSVQSVTVAGLKMGLWLLAYSPYLITLVALLYGGYRLGVRRFGTSPPGNGEGA